MRTGLFKAMAVILLVGVLLALLAGSLLAQAPSSYSGQPKTGDIRSQAIYGGNVGSVIRAQITGGVSGATTFQCTAMAGYTADFFNSTWRVRAAITANVTDGTRWDITDYADNGTFTTQTADGSWAVGDIIEIGKAYALESYEASAVTAVGHLITAAACVDATDTLTIPTLEGIGALGIARYYLEVVYVDESADAELVGTRRIITSNPSSGVFVVIPGFDVTGSTDELDAGDAVRLVSYSDAQQSNGGCIWSGVATSGSGTGDAAAFVITELIGVTTAIPVGSVVRCIKDESATTNDNNEAVVDTWTGTTGTASLTTRGGGDFTVAIAVGDRLMIVNPVGLPNLTTTIQTAFAAAALDYHVGAGELITGAAIGGAVYINSITIQVITANESSGLTSMVLKSTETGSYDLAMPLYGEDGGLLTDSDFDVGCSYSIPVNHLLPVAGTLSLVPSVDTASAGYVVSITYTAPYGASIAGL